MFRNRNENGKLRFALFMDKIKLRRVQICDFACN